MNDFSRLDGFVANGLLRPFIKHIRFPRFKNLAQNFKIEFTYPITALVGPNGTNKSSVLRALQGCPNKYNIGDYWFDTDLDPISDGDPQRYIHGYDTPSGWEAEVIKTRVDKSARGLDYFETSAPRIRDGMARMPTLLDSRDSELHRRTRWKPIEKDVVYLDFRQELPAYDILMHFNWRRKKNEVESKKLTIRKGAPHVVRALSSLSAAHTYYGADRILEPAEELSGEEVDAISVILGRRYRSIRLVRHDYFDVEGYTASLTTEHLKYSEAYAGSGEFAAVMLVRAMYKAPQASLILLDEPETSLHPGAQKLLMRFIARMCVEKKHQVVLATHSPAMVVELPKTAIKLFDINSATGQVLLAAQEASPVEAFTRLGAEFLPRTILVEDDLAKAFVERVARMRGADYLGSINVVFIPGGAQSLAKRVIPVQAQLDSSCVLLLDGDQRPQTALRQADSVVDSELESELRKVKVASSDVIRDGGSGDAGQQRTTQQRKTLKWINNHLDYLPGEVSPDELLLELTGRPSAGSSGQAKKEWVAITREQLGLLDNEPLNATDILAAQRTALALVSDSDENLILLDNTLQGLLPLQ